MRSTQPEFSHAKAKVLGAPVPAPAALTEAKLRGQARRAMLAAVWQQRTRDAKPLDARALLTLPPKLDHELTQAREVAAVWSTSSAPDPVCVAGAMSRAHAAWPTLSTA